MYDLPLRHVPEAAGLGHQKFAIELMFSAGNAVADNQDGAV